MATQINDIRQAYSLKQYLENAALPAFTGNYSSAPIQRGKLGRWPPYENFRRAHNTRKLKEVIAIDWWDFTRAAAEYYLLLPEVHIENARAMREEDAGRLRLPDPELIAYDEDDYERLFKVRGNSDYLQVFKYYILDTVTEILRLIHRLPAAAPLSTELEFYQWEREPDDAMWDIFCLPKNRWGRVPLVIMVLPPTAFDHGAWDEFVQPRRFNHCVLDTLPTDATPAQKLWAVIHDACTQSGARHFVATNYLTWVFGELNKPARVSVPIDAPVVELTGRLRRGSMQHVTVVQHLVHWAQVGRGAATGSAFPTTATAMQR